MRIILALALFVCSLSAQTNYYTVTIPAGEKLDASAAAHTLPSKTGPASAMPSTCSTGEEYFATDATAGRNKYYCVANVWTQQSGGSGGGMVIGGTVTGGTAGSIPYIGAGPVLAQNNSMLFWDATNSRLGVGTTTPTVTLHVLQAGQYPSVNIEATAASGRPRLSIVNTSGDWSLENSGNDYNELSFMRGGNTYMAMYPGQNFTVGFNPSPGGSKISAKGNLSIGSTYYTVAAPGDGAIIQGNVGIGTSSPAISGTGKLHVAGNTARIVDTARTPATSAETCNVGEFSFDPNFIYVCTSASTWKRATLAAF